MIRRSLCLALSLAAAPVLARTSPDLSALSQAQAALRNDLARARRAADVRFPVGAAQAAPAQVATLNCRPAGGAAGDPVTATLDLAGMVLTSDRSGRSPLLDSSKGQTLIDSRCGVPALPLASSLNFEVTPEHYWGQNILQIPKSALAAGAPAVFGASLHVCAYDGDWSDFSDDALTCTLVR